MSLPSNATLQATPYKISVPQKDLEDLHQLLKLSKLPPATYEGQHRKFGVTNAWMREAKSRWENGYDWRASEAKLNKFPQFLTTVKNKDGLDYQLHFVGIFSDNKDAVPLVLLHGWPGSWIEFQHIIPILQKSTSPAFHIIVPSLPGYGVSQQPPLDREFTTKDVTYLVDQLMVGLGFSGENGGYYAQGGDIGRRIATLLGQYHYKNCKSFHVNMATIYKKPDGVRDDDVDAEEMEGYKRSEEWTATGTAYANEHGTRPSTIGHVLASSPLALLAWVGEKFLDWTDKDPTIDQILEFITLWWLTETFPRSIYPYRERFSGSGTPDESQDYRKVPIQVPFGYSWFPKELVMLPKSWIATTGNLVYFHRHESGGHFAAFEEPEELAGDIVEWLKVVRK